jgi:hypothetical protein
MHPQIRQPGPGRCTAAAKRSSTLPLLGETANIRPQLIGFVMICSRRGAEIAEEENADSR